MEENKRLILSILQFFDEQQRSPDLSPDAIESLEVASQCLESAYNISIRDVDVVAKLKAPASLPEIFATGLNYLESPASAADKECAERLKAEGCLILPISNPKENFFYILSIFQGNEFMKQERYESAINAYSEAIKYDSRNAVYYCNRAAAQGKLGNHDMSIEDCLRAISIDPSYAKAYGRKGLAHSSLGQHQEAKECFKKALELDPSNESYRDNLKMAEQSLGSPSNASAMAGGLNLGGMDLGMLLNNPALMNIATNMLSNPQMQSMMASMVSGLNSQAADPGANPISGLLQAGQQLAQQMQQSNPDLVERLRSQMQPSQTDNNSSSDGAGGD